MPSPSRSIAATLALFAATTSVATAYDGNLVQYDVATIASDPSACGTTNAENEYVVGLSSSEFADGAACGKTVRISYGGLQVMSAVVDECTTCASGDIGASRGLYSSITSLSSDSVAVTWDFV